MKTVWNLLFVLIMSASQLSGAAESRQALWQKVDEAIQKGLPRTAITNLNLIIPAALEAKDYGEATKAIARKIALEGNIEGNKPEEKITRIDDEIAQAPPEIVPLLETLRAHWYWHYFQQNRWRFMRRTATAEAPGEDFTTWDLPRLFAEIDKQFSRALSHADRLKEIPVAEFNEVLEKGTMPDAYRPTLYDFIAHEALKFYTSGEQSLAKPEDAFEVSADSPILGPVEAFREWRPDTTQTNAPALKAIQLFQDLLRFHDKDQNRSAFLHVDLQRLHYGYNVAFGETKAARYKGALRRFVDQWMDHELSAVALYEWARVVKSEDDFVEARRLALRGKNAHPDSVGGRLCHNLIEEIEARSLGITTERVWTKPWPVIGVRYRNLSPVHFRIVAWDWDDFLKRSRTRPESLNTEERKELLSRRPTLRWSADLPPTTDYKERVEELPAPQDLKPGHYFLVASQRADFGEEDNQVSYADFWVSDLALVVMTRLGNVEGLVLEANSGNPIAQAVVEAWNLDRNGNRQPAGSPQRTDANGWFHFTAKERERLLVRARARGHELASAQQYSSWEPEKPRPHSTVVFFTDRALYRPGQTIHFKGIALHVDTERDNYEVMGGRRLEFALLDPNGKEVAQQTATTSDYGSFSGNFTAPRDRLMGRYQIQVRTGANGATAFRVEEYKRPKFQVTLEPPKTSPKLGEKVVVPGKAEAYTGAAVDGAKVEWRVVREVRWPIWWGWWGRRGQSYPRGGESQEIAHGTASTGTDGLFRIEFVARPDPQVDEKSEATFRFQVHADVTDSAGETRSDQRTVNVGFVALSVRLETDDWQTVNQPVDLKVRTATLDDEPLAAEGSLKIHRLQEPAEVQRARLSGLYWDDDPDNDGEAEEKDMSNPVNWPLGELVLEKGWTTGAEGKTAVSAQLGAGVYRVIVETQDRFGKTVTARSQLTVLDPAAEKLAIKVPYLVRAQEWQAQPGQEFMAVWGTGYASGRAFIEVEHRGEMIQRYWTKPGITQHQVEQNVTEAMRGGFTVHVTQVRENRAYLTSHHVSVPWNNKDLEVTWEHFTSKLQPNEQETWTAVIARPVSATNAPPSKEKELSQPSSEPAKPRPAEKAVAEMVATLYDESLDAFQKLNWIHKFNIFRHDYSQRNTDFCNEARRLRHLHGRWQRDYKDATMTYRHFPPELVGGFWGYQRGFRGESMYFNRARMASPAAMLGDVATLASAAPMEKSEALAEADVALGIAPSRRGLAAGVAAADGAEAGGAEPTVDLSKVSARKNLNETAFFFPHLTSDSNGVVRMTFTMPEALTTWRFLGFAHDKQVRSGFLEGHAVTSKDLMVQPNAPRFLRVGDEIEFPVKVSNQSAARQQGKVKLTFSYALNEQSADQDLGNSETERVFDIPAKESRSFSWRIKVPDGCGFLTYKAVGSTGRLSDGEEGYLPVLSRRILVTESVTLPIRGPATKEFTFPKLLKSDQSDTLRHESLVVQMVSNPSWYAVLALPYLMEFPHECTEQTFNRFYANTLARHIANSDPKIRRVFDQWKGTPALDSPLAKNEDLKSVILEETPWLRQANKESQARRNVGVLFDDNRLNSEMERALRKLAEAQLNDGSWPWFPGGRGNDFITLYITTGFGRLRHLGADVDATCAIKSLNRLDNWMEERYQRILERPEQEKYVPTPTDALYLYGRSFFLKDQAIAKPHEAMVQFFLGQARKHWLQTGNRQTQAHLALALQRFNAINPFRRADDSTPKDIMRSIKERSVTNEELGMFWRDTEQSWWWYRAPIETQALMIEAFDEIMGDQQAVEECRVWLLKQKQTQDWKTTKATADAVYSLLLRGTDILASDELVQVIVGGIHITPPAHGGPQPETRNSQLETPVEAGTGFYERRFTGTEIKPEMGEITVKKVDEGVAWGSVNWQYLEDMAKVTPHEGTPLKLQKALFVKVNTARGPELQAVKGPLEVGDELVVRIVLRVDRDMEYVHLKDQRGSGTEPVHVLSRYKYQDGLAYYETTRDTASHFFIDYLPKGTYVFEYSTRIQLRGQYQTGVAGIQCMYAPEFNSHSESLPLVVK